MALTPRVFDSAILNRTTSSRAVSNFGGNGISHNFKVDSDGFLMAAPMIDYGRCMFKVSDDSGYTWTMKGGYYIVPRSSTVDEGPCYEVFYDKETDFTTILYAANSRIWIITDDNKGSASSVVIDSPYGERMVKFGTYTDIPSDNVMAIDGNFPLLYCVYTDSSTGKLKLVGIDPTRVINDCIQDMAICNSLTPVVGYTAIKAKDQYVHVAQVASDGGLYYLPFQKKIGNGSGIFSNSPTLVDSAGTTKFRDIGIDICGVDANGLDHAGMIWAVDSGTTASGYYGISSNNGSVWTKIALQIPSGYQAIYDTLTSKYTLHSDIMGGYSGTFLLSNSYMNSTTSQIDTFVKEVNVTQSGTIINDIATASGNLFVGPNGYISIYENSGFTVDTSNTTVNINDITYGSGTFVAVGNSGVLVTSTDGRNWTTRTTGITKDLYAVAYNPSGAYCAVGASGAMLTSPDGVTWTSRNLIANNIDLKGICTYNPSLYWVAVGNVTGTSTSKLYTSTTLDGSNWSSKTIGYDEVWNDITSSSSLIIIVGNNGKIYRSSDGTTWSASTSNTTEQLLSVCRTDARFVATGSNGVITISAAGTNWNTQTSPTSNTLYNTMWDGTKVNFAGSGIYFTSPSGFAPYTTVYSGSQIFTGVSYGTVSGIVYGYDGVPVNTDPWYKINSVSGNILGAKFFKYTQETIPSYGDKGAIRMAYQVGLANDKDGQDTVPSTVMQEKLSNTGYQQAYTGTAFTTKMIDYYASGYINDKTKLYMDDFDKIGTTVSISKYEPLPSSLITGIGSFDAPTTWEVTALIDPGSSTAPTVARGNAEFEEYIGRDSRKIFFKADCFLDRQYIINTGGYRKKTVYTIRMEDKDYQVEQILPRFFNNAILYWEANLFVVSPTNDPFRG